MRITLQFLLFGAVGAIGTAGHYLVLVGLVQFLKCSPVPASAVGFGVGAIINYFLNCRLTFRTSSQQIHTLARFMTVAAFGALLNSSLMWLSIHALRVNYLAAQVAATAVVLILNFTLNKIWTFRLTEPTER